MDEGLQVHVNRKKKATTREELEKLTKEELITRIISLETHNQQLRNIIKKETSNAGKASQNDEQRKFDFSTWQSRHVLLKFYYLGWDYQGFTTQEDSSSTIEHHLFTALQKTCLIQCRETSNYHRCGRTDKGVSAFSQVISIDVRSKFENGKQMTAEGIQNELNYCEMLNRVLPKDIRCIAWQPLYDRGFSARFDCRERTYRYFFPRSGLNIEAMQKGCEYLIGIHDFRNLCKMDVGNGVIAFDRELKDVRVVETKQISCDRVDCKETDPYDILYVQLRGKAFLWHQVRAIMAVLLLIGQENEKPEVIRELLDVERNPCTPQYSLASDIPLNLFNVELDECSKTSVSTVNNRTEDIGWMYEQRNLNRVISNLQQQWCKITVKSQMVLEMLRVLEDIYENKLGGERIRQHYEALQEGFRPRKYQPLMSRTKCKSLENRIDHYAKKRRIECRRPNDQNAIKPN